MMCIPRLAPSHHLHTSSHPSLPHLIPSLFRFALTLLTASSVSVASDSGTDGQYVVRSSRSTALGSELQLELPGRGPLPDYGPCNTHLTVTLEAQSKDRARLRITPVRFVMRVDAACALLMWVVCVCVCVFCGRVACEVYVHALR